MANKPVLQIEKIKPSFFSKIGKEIKKDIKEIKNESKLGAEAVREFFFGPRKITYKKLSNPSQTRTMPA